MSICKLNIIVFVLQVIGLTPQRATPHDSSNTHPAVEMGRLQAIKSSDADTSSSKQ